MKKFLSGFLAGVLVVGASISALAIAGNMTIEVYPINIQVDGAVFAPTDVDGKEVPVFAYQGTTYAPLRALAEAYGLEVGYDAEKNMATVTDPNVPKTAINSDQASIRETDDTEYQEFKAMWKFIGSQPSSLGDDVIAYMFECSTINDDKLEQIRDEKYDYIDRVLIEYAKKFGADSGDTVVGNFTNNARGFFSTVVIP